VCVRMCMYVCVCKHVCVRMCMYVCVCVFDSLMGTMLWLRSVGSLKLQSSFAKEPYERDYILEKRPII